MLWIVLFIFKEKYMSVFICKQEKSWKKCFIYVFKRREK